jgi:hypothetical protein
VVWITVIQEKYYTGTVVFSRKHFTKYWRLNLGCYHMTVNVTQ